MMTAQCSKANAHKLSLPIFNLGNTKFTPFSVPDWYCLLKLNSNSAILLSQFLWCTSLTFQKVQRIPSKSVDASALSQVLFIFCMLPYQLFQVRAAIWSEKVGAEDTVFIPYMFQGILIWRSSSWTHELKTPWATWGHLGSRVQFSCFGTTFSSGSPRSPFILNKHRKWEQLGD